MTDYTPTRRRVPVRTPGYSVTRSGGDQTGQVDSVGKTVHIGRMQGIGRRRERLNPMIREWMDGLRSVLPEITSMGSGAARQIQRIKTTRSFTSVAVPAASLMVGAVVTMTSGCASPSREAKYMAHRTAVIAPATAEEFAAAAILLEDQTSEVVMAPSDR